jgi:hypothetical protein
MTLAKPGTGTEFADLICDDPEWLRAEFDALISASFSEPPGQPPAAPPRLPPDRGFSHPGWGLPESHPARPHRCRFAVAGHGHQRAPPA